MSSSNEADPRNPQQSPAAEQVTHAHELLTELQKRIGEHPELAEAIRKLESALNILAAKTGGML